MKHVEDIYTQKNTCVIGKAIIDLTFDIWHLIRSVVQGFPHVLFLAESAFENRQNDVLNKGEIICEKKINK